MVKIAFAFLFTLLNFTSFVDAAPITTFTSSSEFSQASGPELQFEDWTSYQQDTLLEGKTIDGITYDSTSSEDLVVGSPHGAGWLLGYSRGDGRYASFSFETLTFSFSEPVVAFGISLSQGNSSRSNSYDGSSEWLVSVDSTSETFTSIATYSQSDFTGEAFLGLLNLNPSTSLTVSRVRSDANIVWNVRDISWSSSTPVTVPEPPVALLLITGIVYLALSRRRWCT